MHDLGLTLRAMEKVLNVMSEGEDVPTILDQWGWECGVTRQEQDAADRFLRRHGRKEGDDARTSGEQ